MGGLRPIIVFFAICCWCGAANAQGLTQRQQEIIRTVMSVEGYVTPQLHEEFWNSVPHRTREGVQKYQELISSLVTLATRYQRAAWASTRASYIARRPVRLPELDPLEAELRASLPPPHNARFEASFSSTKRLLEAAADRTALQTPNGPMFITPDLIDRVETGLEASLSRVRRLAAIPYSEAPVARHYPALRAKVLSPDPLIVRHELIDVPTLSSKLRLTSGEWSVSDKEAVMIGSAALPTPVTGEDRIEKTLRATIRGAQRSVQTQDATSRWERWRGDTSLVTDGWALAQGVRLSVSVRAIYVKSSGRLVLFFASGADAVSASRHRAALEMSTHLDE